jgi:hypothetical protein
VKPRTVVDLVAAYVTDEKLFEGADSALPRKY